MLERTFDKLQLIQQDRAMAQKTLKERNIAGKHKKIVQCLKRGYSIKDTCQIVGINPETVYRWLNEAEEDGASDVHIAFFCDFHDARGIGVEKLIKELDQWENETETTTVEVVEFQYDKDGKILLDGNGEPVERLRERKTTSKKKKSRPSHFDRAKFKLQSQYPDRWGSRAEPEEEPIDDDEDKGAVDLFEESSDEDSDS